MTFNKWYPDRVAPVRRGLTAEGRARLFRLFWYASLLMLVTGYVLMFVRWDV